MKRMLLLTAALAAFPALTARAGLIPIEASVTGTDPFIWAYDVSVGTGLVAYSGVPSASGGVNSAAYFTVYDFAGFIPGTCVSPLGWGCSTQNTGLTPAGTLPADDPGIINITWSYLTGDPLFGGLIVTGFSAMSTSNVAEETTFTGSASRANGTTTTGTRVANIGRVEGPSGSSSPPPDDGGTGVPAPGGLGLLSAALIGLGVIRRRKA